MPSYSVGFIRRLCRWIDSRGDTEGEQLAAELRKGLAPSKKLAARRARQGRKLAANLAELNERSEIWVGVMKRAAGRCESCNARGHLELHHVFGRIRVPESVRNCVALCSKCHRKATNNVPSAGAWFLFFAAFFRKRGWGDEAELALATAEGRETKANLPFAPGRSAS